MTVPDDDGPVQSRDPRRAAIRTAWRGFSAIRSGRARAERRRVPRPHRRPRPPPAPLRWQNVDGMGHRDRPDFSRRPRRGADDVRRRAPAPVRPVRRRIAQSIRGARRRDAPDCARRPPGVLGARRASDAHFGTGARATEGGGADRGSDPSTSTNRAASTPSGSARCGPIGRPRAPHRSPLRCTRSCLSWSSRHRYAPDRPAAAAVRLGALSGWCRLVVCSGAARDSSACQRGTAEYFEPRRGRLQAAPTADRGDLPAGRIVESDAAGLLKPCRRRALSRTQSVQLCTQSRAEVRPSDNLEYRRARVHRRSPNLRVDYFRVRTGIVFTAPRRRPRPRERRLHRLTGSRSLATYWERKATVAP